MQKLLAAYKANPNAKTASRLLAYDYKHPFASLLLNKKERNLLEYAPMDPANLLARPTMSTAQINPADNVTARTGDTARTSYRNILTSTYSTLPPVQGGAARPTPRPPTPHSRTTQPA